MLQTGQQSVVKRTPIDLVNAIADSDVNFEEHEIKRDVKEPLTFIDDKTNIDIMVSEVKGGHEAGDDLKAGIEGVQKTDHVGAGSVG